MVPFSDLSEEDVKKLERLIKEKIQKMPDHSIIWMPDYTRDDIVSHPSAKDLNIQSFGAGDKVDFMRGRIVLGKNYLDVLRPGYRRDIGIIICPNCFKKDEEKGEFTQYNWITPGKIGLRLNGDNLELTCKKCSHTTVLEPYVVFELGYGKLNVEYV